MSDGIESKLVFAVAPPDERGTVTLLIGVPAGAWDYMKDGKTQNFDLTRLGVPVQMMLFGAADHDAAMKVLEEAQRAVGRPYLDARREDFDIKPKGRP